MKVRMTVIPHNGPTTVTVITEAEAVAIRNNAFMRAGHVIVRTIEGGFSIEDDNGQTLLVVAED